MMRHPAPPRDLRAPLAALMLAWCGAAQPAAAETSSNLAELSKEVQQLRAEVAALRAQQSEAWLNQQRAEEIRAVAREVLAESQQHPSFTGPVAGHDERGFYLASEDRKTTLRVGGLIQFRYDVTRREPGPGVDTTEAGFSLRRVKVSFEGTLGSPDLEYRVQIAADRDTGGLGVEDAWLRYTLTPDLHVIGGQFQDFFAREQMLASRRLLGTDRTLVTTVFAGGEDYTQGVGLQWEATDRLRLQGTVNDGLSAGRPSSPGPTGTGFLNPGHDFWDDSTKVAFTARADYRLAGPWLESRDFNAWSNSPTSLFLGAGAHYEAGQDPRNTTPQIGSYDHFVILTADALAKYRGLSITGAGYAWFFELSSGNPHGSSLSNYGADIQIAYQVVPDRFEPYAKYEWIRVDPALTDENELNVLTAGFNYYVNRHALRFSADVMWAMDNVNPFNTLGANTTGLGLLPDAPGRQNQVVGRAQIQLMF